MPKIGLCLTNNISLNDWQKAGHFSREIVYLNLFLNFKYKYSIISYGDDEDKNIKIDLEESIKIIPLYSQIKKNRNEYFNNFLHFFRILKNYKNFRNIDLLKSNQLFGSHIAILIGFIFQKKVIVRIGYEPTLMLKNDFSIPSSLRNKSLSNYFFIKLYFLSLFSYQFSNHIICTSKEQKLFISQRYFIRKSKITVIPNWININIFKPNKKMKDKVGILFVGRFENMKNPKLLLKSMHGIKEKVTMIGNGSLKEKLIILAKKYSVELEIIDSLPNSELVSYYQKCKLYVHTSFYEGNPKTILEAMACGCCVIAKDVSGVRELINNDNGVLIKKDSELNSAIKKMLLNSQKRKIISNNARKYIKSNNDINYCFSKEKKLIDSILK